MKVSLDLRSHRPGMPNGEAGAVQVMDEIHTDASDLGEQERRRPSTSISKRKSKKKMNASMSDLASTASSNCSTETSSAPKGIKILRNQARVFMGPSAKTRRSVNSIDFDSAGLPLGMSIAAVVSQVLEKKTAAGENLSVDHLSEICSTAVRESLSNVFGDRFHNFSMNFEKSFRITLMTLRLISDSSQSSGDRLRRAGLGGCSLPLTRNVGSDDTVLNSTRSIEALEASELLTLRNLFDRGYRDSSSGSENVPSVPQAVESELSSADASAFRSFGIRTSADGEVFRQNRGNAEMSNMNQQLVVHGEDVLKQLVCDSGRTSSSSSILTTMEKSVLEQARSNDLKAFEIGFMMKNLDLQKKKMALKSDSYSLRKLNLSIGLSKAFFKAEKFRTQVQEAGQVELLKKCLDFLVAGLIIMLLSLAYGTYTYSYWRIIEASESCSPILESKSRWSRWMPESMSTFNSGLLLLRCQVQVFSRMIFGALMIGAITVLLIQRSSASHQAMPITFILLLLGVACGYAGKFCVDTLGGAGYQWLVYWEALCLLHFFSNIFHSTLYVILHKPKTILEGAEHSPLIQYWVRRCLFFSTLVVLPVLCGLTPFASAWEWYRHFHSLAVDSVSSGEE